MTPAEPGEPDAERDDRSLTDPDAVPETEPGTAPDPEQETEPDWVRRRRLDEVFGGGSHGQALGDRWYQDQVPPHHG